MKGLYIAPVDKKSKIYGGVYKKIQSQIQAFRNLDIDIDYIGIDDQNIIMINDKIPFNSKHLKHQLFFKNILKNKSKILNNYDFVYIRFSFANPYMFRLAKFMKKNRIKVLIEIPTYPYEDEIYNSTKNKIFKKLDRYLWNNKNKYIDNLVLTTNIEELFGIKTVSIFNGINRNDIKFIQKNKERDSINLIGVANVSKWHGYDRIIKGLSKYYELNVDKKVNFFIIGEGAEKQNLQELTNELGLNNYVHFLGAKFGKELDDLYDNMDIGVSSLALFRAGGGHDPIKSKEYVAKGLHVILGYNDRALSNQLEFIYKVAEDNSEVNILEIIEKYEKSNVRDIDIINYANEKLTWESQISKVIDIIKK